jgi:glycogen(starch) synthase
MEATALLEDPSAQVLLVGDGPERPVLEREIRRLGVADRVHLLGFVPHGRVPAVLAHADLLVLPSLYEELGTILLEAMWAGLPIVASKTGGIPDVITDGVYGMLVPPGEPRALAGAIDRVLAEPRPAQRLGQSARERTRDYDWNALADRVLNIYRDISFSHP